MDGEAENQEAALIARTIASECVGARVRMLNRQISRIYDALIRPHGIKFSQMNILTVVTLHGPVQPVEVGKRLSIEKSTLSRNLALMEASGWIRSLPGEGRSLLLRVTPQGRRLLIQAAPAWRRAQQQVTSMLGEGAAAQLRRAASRIREEAFQE